MAETLAELVVRISADASELKKALTDSEKGMKDASGKMDVSANELKKSFMDLGIAATAMGGAIIAALTGAVKSFADTGSELHDLAIKTGVSVEALAGLKYAAEQSGASLGTIEMALKLSSKAIENATDDEAAYKKKLEETTAAGKKEIDTMIKAGATTEEVTAARKELSDTTNKMIADHKSTINSFNKLGLSIADLQKLNPEDQFMAVAKALAGVASQTTRAQIAVDLFGRSGTDLLPILEDGAAGLQTMMNKGVELSGWTTQGAEDADALGDKWVDVKTSMSNVWSAIGESLGPSLIDLSDKLVSVIGRVAEWIKANPELIKTLGILGGILVGTGGLLIALGTASKLFNDINMAWGLATRILPGLTTMIGTSTTGLAGALGLVGLALAGIVGWSIGIKSLVDNFENFAKLFEQGPWKTLLLLLTKGTLLDYGGAKLAPGVKEKADKVPSYASGGIVPGPIGQPQLAIVHGGEQFAGVGNSFSGGGLTVNVGNYLGDDISRRKLMRDLKQLMGEDDRRNQFGGLYGAVNGRSSI
jgi:hypothetical protein